MKSLLIAINTKYIHPNMAVRSLKENTNYDTEYFEYTIKDDYLKIVDDINNYECDLVGLSCYIWNIEMFNKIIPLINKKYLLLGGPEVGFDVDFFFNKFSNVDFIISGEGETSFNSLLTALDKSLDLSSVVNLNFKQNNKIIKNKIIEEDLNNIKHNLVDINTNQIVYLESSRGCPYSCSYCLSSLEKKLRLFDTTELKHEIEDLISQGFNTFKFLDRSFNINVEHAISIISFIIKIHKPKNVFQFEISGDILSYEIIDYIHKYSPPGLFRFEIGIQSTNEIVTEEVNRVQNTKKLFEVIKNIQNHKIIDLHLDLIAGLPKEDFMSFRKTFNDTMELRPLELQLGFLKMLRGTKLRKDACIYDYKFTNDAPYEITQNKYLSPEDIKSIKTVEEALEKYYNTPYFTRTISYILENINAFDFLLDLGKFFEKRLLWHRYSLHELYQVLTDYVKTTNLDFEKIYYLSIYDYLNYSKTKVKVWYDNPVDKNHRNEFLRKFFKTQTEYKIDDLYKYSTLVQVNSKFILKVYKPNNTKIFEIEEI